jgi:hypothetical protein
MYSLTVHFGQMLEHVFGYDNLAAGGKKGAKRLRHSFPLDEEQKQHAPAKGLSSSRTTMIGNTLAGRSRVDARSTLDEDAPANKTASTQRTDGSSPCVCARGPGGLRGARRHAGWVRGRY